MRASNVEGGQAKGSLKLWASPSSLHLAGDPLSVALPCIALPLSLKFSAAWISVQQLCPQQQQPCDRATQPLTYASSLAEVTYGRVALIPPVKYFGLQSTEFVNTYLDKNNLTFTKIQVKNLQINLAYFI